MHVSTNADQHPAFQPTGTEAQAPVAAPSTPLLKPAFKSLADLVRKNAPPR
jgi:hypothetical protein